MKKRLLITSIVMMLVVAVALSTATYAWFTSATTVTANSINLTAGTSQSTALGIQWTSPAQNANFNANYATYIVAAEPSTTQPGGFQPAAPAALDVTTAPTFHTAYIDSQGNFMSTPGDTTTDVYRFGNVGATSDLIHIANLAQSGPVTVYLTANITSPLVAITASEPADTTTYNYYDANKNPIAAGDVGENVESGFKAAKSEANTAVDLIRIAVYEVSGETPTYAYKGLLGKTAAGQDNNTAVGTITKGASAAALVSTTGAKTVTELNLGTLNAQNEKTYAVYVWLDGALFNEAESAKSASVSLTFSTTSAA